MRFRKKAAIASVFTILLLLLCCCIYTVVQNQPDQEAGNLSVTAGFAHEDGTTFSEGIIQLSDGGHILEYPLSDTALAFPNLPRNGSFMLALLDRQEQTQGTMRLSFSEGAVIDATTGKDGVGYVMVSGDTDEVALYFILTEDGELQCTLWLSHPHLPPASLPLK